jgi:hypothetical protein
MGKARRDGGSGGGRLPGRLKGVRKRKRAKRGYKCEVVAQKLRLVQVRTRGER